jgi:signal transduction histidine kinase
LVYLIGYFWKRDRSRWEQNQQLNRDLQRTQEQLRKYAEQVADTVVLEERNRLSRDIHDSVGHNLTAATIQLSKAEAYFKREPATSLQALTEARNCIQEGMRDIREVLGTLNNETKDFDIFNQIRKLIDRLPEEHYKIDVTLEGNQLNYNRAVLLALYRMVQEGTTNILKHSQASQVEIGITLGKEKAVAFISDNGVGFYSEDLQTAGRKHQNIGLEGLRERIGLVRGVLTIYSVPGEGTRLEAVLPREPTVFINGELP